MPLTAEPYEFKEGTELNVIPTLWKSHFSVNFPSLDLGWNDLDTAIENGALIIFDDKGKGRPITSREYYGDTELERKVVQASADGRLWVRRKDADTFSQIQSEYDTENFNVKFSFSKEVEKLPGGIAPIIEAPQQQAAFVPQESENTEVKDDADLGQAEQSVPVQQAVKPVRPSLWVRFLALFLDSYAQQVRDYETALAVYNAGVINIEPQKSEEPVEKEIKEQIKEEVKEVTKEQTKEAVPEKEQEQPRQKRFAEYELPFKNFFDNVHTNMQKAIPANDIAFLQADEEQRTLLAVAAMANPDLKITRGKKATNERWTEENKPDEYYPDLVDDMMTGPKKFLNDSTRMGLLKAGVRKMNQALGQARDGNYEPLAELIALGLKQNNKLLKEEKSVSDRFTIFAQTGEKLLNFAEKNEGLNKALDKYLDAGERKVIKSAAAISNLRLDALAAQQNLLGAYQNGSFGNETELCTLAQFCAVNRQYAAGKLDLTDNPYTIDGMADKFNAAIKNDPAILEFKLAKALPNKRGMSAAELKALENQFDPIETLQNPENMATLYSIASNNAQKKKMQQKSEESVQLGDKTIEAENKSNEKKTGGFVKE